MSDDGADRQHGSAPDAHGVRTRLLDVGAKSTLRGRRLRQCDELRLQAAASWPLEWRELARDWLKGSATTRWRTLLDKAGHKRSVIATEVLEALLHAGWIVLEENREQGRWVPLQIVFRDFEAQRDALGLPHRERLARERDARLAGVFGDAALDAALENARELPAAIAIRRHGWLDALHRWQAEQRSGTRRDFAYFASGDTKGIADADWNWLADTLALSDFGVEAHTPLLLLRAPLAMARVPDFVGLTPATIDAGIGLEGQVAHGVCSKTARASSAPHDASAPTMAWSGCRAIRRRGGWAA